MMTRLARRRTLGRIAAELRLQLHEIGTAQRCFCLLWIFDGTSPDLKPKRSMLRPLILRSLIRFVRQL